VVDNNPFAFTPGHLNKLLNPKSLAAFKALGGVLGLEKGLKTDLLAGLSVDETTISEKVTFEQATAAAKKPQSETRIIPHEEGLITQLEVSGQFTDRHRVFKDNRLPVKKPTSIWKLFWNAYNDRILILLTFAAAISLSLGIYEAVGGEREPGEPQPVDWVEGLAIIVAIVIVVIVTGLNDYRRNRQFAKLNAKKDDRVVKAVRSGKTIQISVYDVTVGDLLHLESGDSLPADGVLIAGHGVTCDESSATGESDAMKKMTGQAVWEHLLNGTATNKMDPFIISGAKVLEGVGTYLVTSVGVNSSYGKIMMSLQDDVEETPLQVKLGKLANWIGLIGSSAAATLFFVLLFRFLATLSTNENSPSKKGSQFLDILIVAVTIIVVAVPEGLPLSVTLALSFATKRMYRENNLVRHLRACETMGNATTICSDKTGTLTQNKMTVVAGTLGTGLSFHREPETSEKDQETLTFPAAFSQLSPAARALLLQSIAINSTAFEGEQDGQNTFIGSKTETALLVLAKEQLGMGPLAEERAGVEVVQLYPFDSNRKCMGAVIRLASGTYRLLVKGAAEIMLLKATKEVVELSGETLRNQPLTEAAEQHVSNMITAYAEQSLRTIGMLYRDFEQWPPAGWSAARSGKESVPFEDILCEMTFLGVVGIQDPLRDGVAHAVKQCQMAGIKVRMVTGDNVTTARAIATQCGIKTPEGLVMEGPKFRQLSDEELDGILPQLEVLARSSPEDKRILVARLKHLGETVAVTGDGTNDAPALKTADIGFSMGIAGTEVAKEASSIILMDDNFRSIVKAIMWGRSVNDAVSKFLQFQITVNITAVILAFVSAVSSSEGHSVLSAVQLLWVNLIMDTFAALALATDAPTEAILDRPPAPKSAPLITTNMWKMIIGQSIYQLAVTFVVYFAGAKILNYNLDQEFESRNDDLKIQLDTLVFNIFVWMQVFNMYNNRRLDNRLNILEGLHRNYFFMAISCIMVGGQVMIIYVGGIAFQIVPLNGEQWGISILCALPCLLWAVLIRCIPDKYAAIVFHWAGIVWFTFYRPLAKVLGFIFKPLGRGIRSVYRPVARGVKRASRSVSPKHKQDEQPKVDEEAPSEKPSSPASNLPPITLTTVN
jgi:Ca2+-transporting ATPase